MSEEVKKIIDEFVTESNLHKEQVNSISSALTSTTDRMDAEIKQYNEKLSSLKSEIPGLKAKINQLETQIKADTSTIEELKPMVELQEQTIVDLNQQIEVTENKVKAIYKENKNHQIKFVSLVSELKERKASYDNIKASNSNLQEISLQKIQSATDSLNEIEERFWALDYIYNKIDLPEVEIMGIIASNRRCKTEDIKARSKNVQAVLVGRALSKLEADNKIIQVEENVWDISSVLLNQL